MNGLSSEAHTVQGRVAAVLAQCRAQSMQGQDIAPAQLHRLEGLLDAILAAGWQNPQQLIAWCRPQLPANARILIETDGADAVPVVRLDWWQERAPVVPTTAG